MILLFTLQTLHLFFFYLFFTSLMEHKGETIGILASRDGKYG